MWLNSEPSGTRPEYLKLYWNNDLLEEKVFTQPVSPAELIIMVGQVRLIEGEHVLRYTVRTSNGEDAESQGLIIIIDKTPPMWVSDGALLFPTAVINGGVTELYLKDNNDILQAEVPDYLVSRPGDLITWYWSTSPTGSEVVGSRTLALADIGQPITLDFTGPMIRDRGDGTRYASYTVEDRSGNASPRSLAVQLQVSAQPIPRDLPPPTIKEASGSANSSTLNPSNAITGVTVQIPAAATINPGEKVFVQWARPGTVGEDRVEVPAGSRECRIPANRIAQHFGTNIPVIYEVIEPGVADPLVSRTHTLTVSAMTGFPVVQCDRVAGGQLKLANIADGGLASFTLERWPFMATDQFINIEVSGVDSNNQGLVIPVLQEYRVPEVAQVINVGNISKANLQRFKVPSQLDVIVRVSFDNKGHWQAFPRLTPQLVS